MQSPTISQTKFSEGQPPGLQERPLKLERSGFERRLTLEDTIICPLLSDKPKAIEISIHLSRWLELKHLAKMSAGISTRN
jgi:hypothetical protein